MNKEAIIKLISEPNELSKVSIEELEEMVHEYPYFNILHVLLHTKKQHVEAKETSENIIEEKNRKKENNVLNTHVNDDNDSHEFEELEEKNSQLPFHEATLKFNTNNSLADKTENELPESQVAADKHKEIVEEDIARLLSKTGSANADAADDLTLINKINTQTQNLLNKNGLYTYAQFKKIEENSELELLAKLVDKKVDVVSLWNEDCAILYQNKYHRLLFEKIGLALKNKQNNLQKINGIGPILEAKLNEIGVLNYQQLALLEKSDIEILTELIDYFPGRIERDEWVVQAALKHKENDQTDEIEKQEADQDNEIERLKAKVEAHKNLKQGIGIVTQNELTININTQEQSRETFRDWLTKMNSTSNTSDEKKNLLVNNLTNKRPT